MILSKVEETEEVEVAEEGGAVEGGEEVEVMSFRREVVDARCLSL